MADEKKTYLIEVKSNLDKYAKEADEAAKKVADLKAKLSGLSDEQKKDGAAVEALNAQYREAQKEYKQAKKMVDLQTAANKSEAGSRKQLGEILKLQEQELGKLGKAYIVNAKGVRELNPLYVEQRKRIKETKDAIIEYDKSLGDGRSSVGLYSEALEGLPGPLGAAAGSVKALGAQLKALLLNPVVLVVSAIVGVFVLLYKAFKKSQENSIVLNKAMGGLKGIFQTLLNVLKPVAEFIANTLVKGFEVLGKVADKAIGLVSKGLKFLGFDKAAESVNNWVETIKEGAKAGSDLAEAEIRLRNAQREAELIRFKYLKQEEKLRQIRDDEALSIDERIKANKELGDVLMQQSQAELAIANMALDVANKRISLEGETEENLDKRAEALTKIADIEEAITGFQSEQLVNINSLRREADALLKTAKDKVKKEVDDYKKRQEEFRKADLKAIKDKKKQVEDLAEWERNRQLSNQENLLSIRESNNDYIVNIERARLEIQRKDEIANAEKNGADINIINAKYAAAQRKIDEAEQTAKLGLYSDFAGNLATIFGEQSAIGKAAAVAQTTIATYTAAMEAYKSLAGVPVVGPALGIAAAAAATAAGIATVKKILAVDTGGQEAKVAMKASMPTAIVASAPAQRSIAAPAGSTIFTQPQLSQQQLNALPQQSMLSAEDIAQALSRMPAPKVSVEDINARMDEVKKVKVRADI